MSFLFLFLALYTSTNRVLPTGKISLVFKGIAIEENICEIDSLTPEGTCYKIKIDSVIYASDSLDNIHAGECVKAFSFYLPNVHSAEEPIHCPVGVEGIFFLQTRNTMEKDSLTFKFMERLITVNERYISIKESRGWVPDFIPYVSAFGQDFKDKAAFESFIMNDLLKR